MDLPYFPDRQITPNMSSVTGYGPSRLMFDGDENNYEMFEIKFMGHLHRLKLKAELKKEDGEIDPQKNEDIFAELVQVLDDRSLALIMRDAKDDGKKALKILREHYLSQGKPKIIALYTDLSTLRKHEGEDVTGYVIRAEKSIAALRNCGENFGLTGYSHATERTANIFQYPKSNHYAKGNAPNSD